MSLRHAWILALGCAAAGACGPEQAAEPGAPKDLSAQAGGPERRNRLEHEQSPYLLQHATNPVDWYPWGEEAFARARAEDRPIFLSIGYATCHWCHVMERESFEDEEVARLLNEGFVCVKVDREERPDVDRVYMEVTQALTGTGGWPNTLFLTPEGKPFFATTYVPRESRGGRRGMLELVPFVAELWRTRRADLVADGDAIAAEVGEFLRSAPSGEAVDLGELAPEAIGGAVASLAGRFDEEHGGFGTAPKFPNPHALLLLLHHHERTGDERALAMALATLDALRRGGIWDHVGFGFHRYATDAAWRVPHFEKMLYDQALLAEAYVTAWLVTHDDAHRRTAEEILAYVLRDLAAPGGGFHSAEDADSEGVEGRFYLWTADELRAVLGEEEGALFARAHGVGPQGLPQLGGGSVLHLPRPLAELARELGVEEAALRTRLEAARVRLLAAREQRVRPFLDDKVLTDWNGLMIAALARAGAAFEEPRYVDAARRAAEFALAHLRDADGELRKRWRAGGGGPAAPGVAEPPATLDDHAFLGWGLLELYEAELDPRWLAEALAVTEEAVERFHDPEHGGFFLAPAEGTGLFVRPKQLEDGAVPAGSSVLVSNLQRLARITARADLAALADGTLRAAAGALAAAPAAYARLLLALDFARGPISEVVVAGDPGADDTRALLRALRTELLPRKVLLLRPPDGPDGPPPITRLAPWTLAQTPRDGRALAYVCRDHACQAPTSDPAAVLAALRERGE